MNLKSDQPQRQPYVKPTLNITYIELEESIAAASVQPINNYPEVKEEWDELGDVIQDVEW
ncbi:hypothetical protein [Sphingobacterium faecale]|uniref:Uncharacterized protein n=1 Tax=Sphingobacterium faecale TaxID=2803775 RepID=A0ABS1R6Z9_9SPHI|nr:hypothetical protein [Sphingobacterium faecale]MBL1410468.1 hypothetical protein [Sphingobacterium faecale]